MAASLLVGETREGDVIDMLVYCLVGAIVMIVSVCVILFLTEPSTKTACDAIILFIILSAAVMLWPLVIAALLFCVVATVLDLRRQRCRLRG
jgi:nitrogen fixation/metabolism regulation signal transduction histidine kinase